MSPALRNLWWMSGRGSKVRLMRAQLGDFWLAFESNPVALRNGCAQTGNWPGVCTVFLRELQVRVADERWELSVMCRMIDPGLTLERMPTCNELATMTTVNRLTLHDGGCGFATQEECISNLCDVYSQFTWRMHPRNLIPDRVRVPFDYTYVLSGCEDCCSPGVAFTVLYVLQKQRITSCFLSNDIRPRVPNVSC
eukprot:g33371.t1